MGALILRTFSALARAGDKAIAMIRAIFVIAFILRYQWADREAGEFHCKQIDGCG